MRIRSIKPEFFHHERLFDAEKAEKLPLRLAFIGLWCAADREGRFRWEPRRLGVQILPYDQVDFSRVLDALATRGFVVRYASNGAVFGAIPSFLKHQVINNREGKSQLPPPPVTPAENQTLAHEGDACGTREAREGHACKEEGKGREGNKEGKGKEGDSAFALVSPWHVQFGLDLPETLRSKGCLDAVRLWLEYKRERRDAYKVSGLHAALTKWGREFTPDTFPAAVEHSMANNWKGIFAPSQSSARPQSGPRYGTTTDADEPFFPQSPSTDTQ